MKKNLALLLLATLLLTALVFTSCSKGVELTAPQNIRYDGTTITWDPVENAEEYSVKIGENAEFTVQTNSANYAAGGAEFTVTITAKSKAEKIIPSQATTVIFKPLDSIKELRVSENAVVSWDPVANATGYIVRIDGKDVEMIVNVGDKVLYSKCAGSTFKIDGEELTIIKQSDILAVVED